MSAISLSAVSGALEAILLSATERMFFATGLSASLPQEPRDPIHPPDAAGSGAETPTELTYAHDGAT